MSSQSAVGTERSLLVESIAEKIPTPQYCSTQNIIRAANSLISRNKKRVEKQMVTDNEDGEEVEIFQGDTEKDEAEIIAKKILELTEDGYRFGQVAILARLYRLMPPIEGALIKEKIPYNPSGKFFYDREDMRISVSTMEYLSGGNPEETLDLDRLNGIREDLYAHHEEMTLRAAFEVACTYNMAKRTGEFPDEETQLLKRTYLDALEHLVSPHEDLSGFLAHIEDARRVDKFSYAGKVTLMTIHQAKGLEFKCVIIPGLNEGILPHINSVEDLANMEER
jgi:DNA helicase II / ATP-dependent DNA helicase PcrA